MFRTTTSHRYPDHLRNPVLDAVARKLFNDITALQQQLDDLEIKKQLLQKEKEELTANYNGTEKNEQSLLEARISKERNEFAEQSLNKQHAFQQHQLEESCRIATLNDEIQKISTALKQLKQKVEEASQPDQTTGKPSSTASQYTIFLNDYR